MADLTDNQASDSPVDERMREFGEYLRDLRKRARYSLEQLAEELRKRGVSKHGTSRQYLGALERGEVTNPSPELLLELTKALDDMSSEFWLLAGHLPPGPEGEAIAELVREANRKGFSRMLKDEGLSYGMIQNVLSKVSAETIDRVARREEPLVIKQSVSDEEWAGHQALGFETHTIDADTPAMVRESPSDYLGSVKGEFESKRRRRPMAAARAPARRSGKPTTIGAGPDARIVVYRHLEPDESKALEDIGKVIAHLLRK